MQQRILDALKSNTAVRTLASNPLLCALMCALNRFYKEELPRDLHELCQSACQMLLWDRDFRIGLVKGACPPGYEKLSKADRLHVAQCLAYDMVKESGATLPRNTALATIHSALSMQPGEAPALTEEVLEGLIQRSSLVRPCDEDDVEFAHNILRDYLASSLFAQNDEWDYLVKRLDVEGPQRWEPIILFAVANDTRKPFVVGLMEALLNTSRVSTERLLYRQLVTLKADGRLPFRLSRDTQAQVDSVRQNLGKIDTPDKAIALAEAGETAVDFLQFRVGMSEEEEASCVQGLGRIEGAEANERLKEYLRPDAAPAVLEALTQFYAPDEMAAVVNVLHIPSVVESLQYGEASEEYLPHIFDLSPLQSLTTLKYLNLEHTQVSDLSPLRNLFQLRELYLDGTNVNRLAPLENLVQLRILSLWKTHINDLSPLQKLTQITSLSIRDTDVSDLSPLRQSERLQSLWLIGTKIDELSCLQNLVHLHSLWLRNTQITDAEIRRFQQVRRAMGLKQVNIFLVGN